MDSEGIVILCEDSYEFGCTGVCEDGGICIHGLPGTCLCRVSE